MTDPEETHNVVSVFSHEICESTDVLAMLGVGMSVLVFIRYFLVFSNAP